VKHTLAIVLVATWALFASAALLLLKLGLKVLRLQISWSVLSLLATKEQLEVERALILHRDMLSSRASHIGM